MRVVRLNGELGKKYGRVHRLDVQTPAEAVRALIANFPGLHRDLALSQERGVGYKCVVDREQITEDRLVYPISRSFSITPVVVGAGKIGQIIFGTILLGFALAATGGLAGIGIAGLSGATMGAGIGFMGLTYGSIAFMGAGLILGGIAQILTPTPKAKEAKKEENPYFSGAVNTTEQGVAVPIGYGRCIVGSALISANITTQDNSPLTAPSDYVIGGFNIP